MKFVFLLCFLSLSFAQETQETLQKWRQAIQNLAVGLSRATLPEEFNPEALSTRNITIALNQQAGRFRAQVARAIQQSITSTVSTCPPLEISDQAIISVREELKKLGFKVEWKCLAEHYSSGDPMNLELVYRVGQTHVLTCPGSRAAFRVEVPIKKKE